MKNLYVQPWLSSLTNKPGRVACLAAILCIAGFFPVKIFAQAPIISYGTPSANYFINAAITPLNPSNSGGAVAAPTGAAGAPVLLGSGLTFSINGATVDAAGNMYLNDQDAGVGDVKKITADGSSTTIIGSGFLTQSANVAVDQAGNVYVADQARVWKIPASGNPVVYGTPVVINNSFPRPFGIATDAAGNVYVADLNAGVFKMASDGSNKVKIDNGISSPSAITVDAAGNVYAVTIGDLKLYEIPANGSPQVVLASGFNFPRGLAVDATGTIYIDDEGASTIFTVPQGGGTPITYVSGLSNAVGVAVDAGYHLFVALQGAGGMTKYSPTGGYFISPLLPAGLSFNASTGVISGTPTASSPAKDYVISGYNSSGGSSATINIATGSVFFSYSSPQTYTAGTAITALDPSISAGSVAGPGYKAPPVSIGSGFSNPFGVAVDASGNVYVADAGNSAVKKIPVGGGAPVSIGSGFDYPTGVAVDAAGDVFVADPGNSSVFEIPAGGSAQITLGSGFVGPNAVAVDASGNVYVTDENTGTLYKIPAGNGTPIILGAGFSDLTAVSVDQSGNLYVVDGGMSAVYTVPVGGGIPVSLGGSFLYPTGIAADASGNVYVTDGDANHVFKLSACGCTQVSVAGFLNSPNGLAVDGAGNIYVGDTNDNRVKKITPKGGYFINAPLPAGLSLDITSGEISGKPKRVSAATNYTITAYNSAGAGLTTLNIEVTAPAPPAISYAAPPAYTAGLAISPLTPSSTGGTVATPAYSNSPIGIGSGFNNPFGIATDALGNIYIADAGNSAVKKIPAGGGTPVSIGSGFDYPTGVAVDAAGDVFVADQGNHSVFEIPVSGPQVALGSGFSAPDGVAVDASGNVYVTDEITNSVYEIPAGNGTPVVLVSGFLDLTAIAIDSSGNLFITDGGAGMVYRLPKSGSVPIPVGSLFIYPTGVAVDAQGNVYVADGDAGALFKLPGGGYGQIAIANGFNEPGGVAVDGSGNLYVGDTNNNAVDEIIPAGGYFISASLPLGLKLDAKTGIISGTPTIGSPATNYTITAYNAGGSSAAVLSIAVNIPPPPVISYNSPQRYPLGIAITPLTPTSTGVGQPAYQSTTGTVGSGFSFPYSTAIDKSGNIYVADAGNAAVWELPAGGGPKISIGSGFNGPTGVAVDTLGNVYVADAGASDVVKIPAGGGPQVFLGAGFNYPNAVAVDRGGNVYIADAGTATVYRILAGHTGFTVFARGFSYPSGVAVDNAGNVYVADEGSGAPSSLYEIAAGSSTKTKIVYNFNLLTGVATDVSGNLYAADGGVGKIIEFPSGGGSPAIINGLTIPFGMAVDGAGNLYTADIGTNTVDKITPAGGYFISAILPAGLSFNSTAGAITGTPTAVTPAKDYTVTAYSFGGSHAATVNIKILSNDPNLLHLVLNSAKLSPAFTSGTYSYSVSVLNAPGNITVTPTADDPDAVITVNGTTVSSGTASGAIPLNVGSNTITVIVTSEDGSATKTYVITATRAPSNNANLSLVRLNPSAAITTVAGPDFKDYTASVSNATSSIQVIPTTAVSTSTVTVNGIAVASGASSDPITLNVGSNTIIIVVTAEDAATTRTYSLSVTRLPSVNTDLVSIHPSIGGLTPAFSSATISYTSSVGNLVTSMTVTPTTADPQATIKVNGISQAEGTTSAPISLNVGDNAIAIDVTSGDGNQHKTYTLTVTRAGSSNALLSSLVPSQGVRASGFAPLSNNLALTVGYTTTSVTITPTTRDATATVTVNGVAVTSGTASAAIPLNVGDNTITTVVTAQDMTTTNTYTMVVTRAMSSNANLITIRPSHGTLSPSFSSAVTTYAISVAYGVSSITVAPGTQDATASFTVNGSPLTSGSTSTPISLNVGDNPIAILVTAQDGTQKTYTVTVTRAMNTVNAAYQPISVSNPTGHPQMMGEEINVHQGLSPNGDGINDFLLIDGINNYPDNKLQIMNRSGQLVFEAKGYDNSTKVFDGHSNKNGAMQLPGTYFYSLDYAVNGVTQHKTGFIVLKY